VLRCRSNIGSSTVAIPIHITQTQVRVGAALLTRPLEHTAHSQHAHCRVHRSRQRVTLVIQPGAIGLCNFDTLLCQLAQHLLRIGSVSVLICLYSGAQLVGNAAVRLHHFLERSYCSGAVARALEAHVVDICHG